MRGVHSAVDEIRRNVFTEVARLAYEGGDLNRVDMIPYTIVPGEVARHRHDVFLERAIVQERVRLALGMSLQPAGEQTPVSANIQEAASADDKYFEEPLVNIISFACNACPPKQIRITDSCQGCLSHPCMNVCPKDAIYLDKALERSGSDVDSLDKALSRYKELSLGDMQAAYSGLLSALHACINYREIDYYPQKMTSIRKQIALYKAYYNETERQRKTLSEQFALTRRQYARDSLLYSRSVISSYEHETARASLLQSRYSLEGAAASAENLRIQIGEQEQSLLDLTLERSEKEFTLRQELQTAREQLLNSMNEWRLRYCLIAPVGGVVTFTKYWNENQYIPSGEVAFTVVPQGESRLVGKVRIPIARSGKVRRGQRAIVRFSNFPDQEFGVVNGVVSNISLVPTDEYYTADIDFPEGLRTNYGIDLPVSPETQASAEIVTEELRLIERFFLPIKRIVKEGF